MGVESQVQIVWDSVIVHPRVENEWMSQSGQNASDKGIQADRGNEYRPRNRDISVENIDRVGTFPPSIKEPRLLTPFLIPAHLHTYIGQHPIE